MKDLTIFGENFTIVEQESAKDSVRLDTAKVLVSSYRRPADSLLREFLAGLLYSELFRIYDQIRTEGKVEIFGDLDFEVVEKIDNKRQRVAKLDGSKVLIKLNAVALPKNVLKYVIAHEVAHTFLKRHTKRFWKTVELMCPDLEETRELIAEYGHLITSESIPQLCSASE